MSALALMVMAAVPGQAGGQRVRADVEQGRIKRRERSQRRGLFDFWRN